MKLGMVLVVVGAVAACTQAQKPYTFVAPNAPTDAVEITARTLAQSGHEPARVDAATGIVMTKWEDTGFGYGFVQGQEATIVRRFTVTLAKRAAGMEVIVRQDGKRCQKGGFTLGDVDVRGPCEAMNEVVDRHQKDVDDLGARLRQALAQR